MQINGIVVGLLDTGANATTILLKSWLPDCSLQKVNVQLLRIRTLFHIKQSTGWVKYIGPEVQIGKLKTYVTNIAINLWCWDLLQQ